MLDVFAKEIAERVAEVRAHAGKDGTPDLSDPESDEAPAIGPSAYSTSGRG